MKPIIKSPVDQQLSLFIEGWEQLQKEYGISYQQSILLQQLDVLSFNPEEKDELQEFEIRELVFLKKLFFDSGLPHDYVFSMLALLEKPYRYSFNSIYWDFDTAQWKYFQDYIEKYYYPNMKSHIFSRIDDIFAECDMIELQYFKSAIDNAIKETEDK
jgi:hypothetical protein